jgi:hypothetical protein
VYSSGPGLGVASDCIQEAWWSKSDCRGSAERYILCQILVHLIIMALFGRSSEDKVVVGDLVAKAGKRILCGKEMAFKPSIDLAVLPRLFLVVRYERHRDSYTIRDRATNVDFPHPVLLRELSIGERSREACNPLIRALVDVGLDPNPWLKEGQVVDHPRPGSAGARVYTPPVLGPVAPPFVPPPPPSPRPTYYPGTIPVPVPICGPPPLPTYPPGFGPPCGAPGHGAPPPGFFPCGPAPYWFPPPFRPCSHFSPISCTGGSPSRVEQEAG